MFASTDACERHDCTASGSWTTFESHLSRGELDRACVGRASKKAGSGLLIAYSRRSAFVVDFYSARKLSGRSSEKRWKGPTSGRRRCGVEVGACWLWGLLLEG